MKTRYLRMSHAERLTVREAEALIHAAGNTLDWPDSADAVFNNDRGQISAANKACAKLQRAINEQKGKEARRG